MTTAKSDCQSQPRMSPLVHNEPLQTYGTLHASAVVHVMLHNMRYSKLSCSDCQVGLKVQHTTQELCNMPFNRARQQKMICLPASLSTSLDASNSFDKLKVPINSMFTITITSSSAGRSKAVRFLFTDPKMTTPPSNRYTLRGVVLVTNTQSLHHTEKNVHIHRLHITDIVDLVCTVQPHSRDCQPPCM